MPQRFLKPGITTSAKWNACSWIAQSFYIRLITLVDDYGRFEANPRLLRSLAFPLSEDLRTEQVLALMKELQEQQLAHFYKAGEKEYLQLTGWSEKARAAGSRFPELDDSCEQMFTDVSKCCPSSSPSSPSSSPPSMPSWAPDDKQKRLNALFKRRNATRWDEKERKAYAKLGEIAEEDLRLIEVYYTAKIQKGDDFRRRDLGTLLNNFQGEVDRARAFRPAQLMAPF